MLPAPPPVPVVQSCWLLVPPRLMSPVVLLALTAPQLSDMRTNWPDSEVVTVPLV